MFSDQTPYNLAEKMTDPITPWERNVGDETTGHIQPGSKLENTLSDFLDKKKHKKHHENYEEE
jgi:hypothetical protein